MPYIVSMDEASESFPQYSFVEALTPSEQKAAFHVRDVDGADLCLKLIAPANTLDRLQREVVALQAIAHPNVVKLLEYTFSSRLGSEKHYMVEEFVAGNDLTFKLTSTPWDLPEATAFFAQLAGGLEALRQVQIVHRDLKPSNIRVSSDDTPVIIDFGLARHLRLPDLTDTGQGARFGTPLYFAPEQFAGTKYDIDHRTDLFALGVLLYEAVVGSHPFFESGMGAADLEAVVCEDRAGRLACSGFERLPATWKLLLSRLLSVGRASRPRSAGQVAIVLGQIAAETAA